MPACSNQTVPQGGGEKDVLFFLKTHTVSVCGLFDVFQHSNIIGFILGKSFVIWPVQSCCK